MADVLTVPEVVALYLADVALRVRAKQMEERSRDKPVSYCEDFARFMGRRPVSECRKGDLTRWLLTHPEWESDHTKADATRAVSTCFTWAVGENYIQANPYRNAKLAFDLAPRQAMTIAQYVAIMRAAHRSIESFQDLAGRLEKEAAARARQWYDDEAKTRQREAGKTHGRGQQKVVEDLPQPITGKARDLVGKAVGVDPRPLAVHLDDFRDHVRQQDYHRAYVHNLVRRARQILDGCGFEFITDLSASAVAAYVAGQPMAPGTRKGHLQAVKHFAAWLVESDRMPDHPLAHLDNRENSDHRGRPSSGKALRRCLFFLRRSGARTCEMRALKWSDVDWADGVARLWQHKTKKKSAQARIIGLEPCLLRFLQNLYRQRGDGQEFVFVSGRNGKLRNCKSPLDRAGFARTFRAYARRAGVPEEVSAYSARHMFTVHALEAGIGERQVADQLGHSTTRFVAYYGKSTRTHADYLRNVARQAMQGRRRNSPRQ